MTITKVSQTPADLTLGWDPSQPITIVLDTDVGTWNAASVQAEMQAGVFAIFGGVVQPGYTGSVVLSNANQRVTFSWKPVGDWLPNSNYGGIDPPPPPWVDFVVEWFASTNGGGGFINEYAGVRFTTGPAAGPTPVDARFKMTILRTG